MRDMVITSPTRAECHAGDAETAGNRLFDLDAELVDLARRAMSVATNLVDDPASAVDVVTAAFSRALRPQPAFAPSLSMRVFSAIVDLAASPDRTTRLEGTTAVSARGQSTRPGEPTAEELRAALSAIPVACRIPLLLIELGACTYYEAVEILGTSPDDLARKLASARHALARNLGWNVAPCRS